MLSRNLFILAAAMQLPLALWLHGCKDDKDDEKTTTDDSETKPQDDDSKPQGTESNSEKLHAKYFLSGQHKELISSMKDKVTFDVRETMFNQLAEVNTAYGLASFINESTEGMVSLYGSAFSNPQLLKEWRADFVADMWDTSVVYQNVAPGTVSTNALQIYMMGKPNPVMFSPFRYAGGNTMAQTKIVDVVGPVDMAVVQNNQFNQQLNVPKRNLIVTELYTGAYDISPCPPKNNPHNVAVTFFQVTEDLDMFFEICTRAFYQVLAVNQMLAMQVEPKTQGIWDTETELEKPLEQKKEFPQLTAWEVLEKQTPGGKYERLTQYGSRQPRAYARHEAYIHELQVQVNKDVKAVRQALNSFLSSEGKLVIDPSAAPAKFVSGSEFEYYVKVIDWNSPEFVQHYMSYVLDVESKGSDKPVFDLLTNIAKNVDLIYKDSTEKQFLDKEEFVRYTSIKTFDYVNKDYSVCGVTPTGILLPKFLRELLFTDSKALFPEKAGLLTFEQFARDLRRDSKQYLIPKREELMTLSNYQIDVLEVIHPGQGAEVEFAEVMMVAFLHAFRVIENSTSMQNASNHQVIFGDASAIYGHNGGMTNVPQMPYSTVLPWKNSFKFDLRFITLEHMTAGEQAVECFKTIADRLESVDVKVTIQEHVEVSRQKLKPKRAGSKNSGIHQQIRTMQQQ